MEGERGIARHGVDLVAPEDVAGERLDVVVANLLPGLSRSKVQRLIAAGSVTIDGRPATKPSTPVRAGQRIVAAPVPSDADDLPTPQAIDLRILYEDDDVVVVDKPAGLVVHGGAGHHERTLVDGLLHLYGTGLSRRGGAERPGIVHRLDKGTSGVMAVARNDDAHDALAAQFAARSVEKRYAAIVYGCPREAAGEIDLPIGRDRGDRTKVSPRTDRPRPARTRWEVTEALGGFALLLVRPETGRMHQIRTHLASIHHPCIGDPKYAGAQWKGVPDPAARKAVREFPRPALHAAGLRLAHPRDGAPMEFAAALPDDLETLLRTLRSARDEA